MSVISSPSSFSSSSSSSSESSIPGSLWIGIGVMDAGSFRYAKSRISFLGTNIAHLVFKTQNFAPSRISKDNVAYSCTSFDRFPQNRISERVKFCSRCYPSGSSLQECKSNLDAFEYARKQVETVEINLHLLDSDEIGSFANFGLILAITDICKIIFPQMNPELSSFSVHSNSKKYSISSQLLPTPPSDIVLLEIPSYSSFENLRSE